MHSVIMIRGGAEAPSSALESGTTAPRLGRTFKSDDNVAHRKGPRLCLFIFVPNMLMKFERLH
jgi:hypothetical protein